MAEALVYQKLVANAGFTYCISINRDLAPSTGKRVISENRISLRP